jgi:hypothetical protein
MGLARRLEFFVGVCCLAAGCGGPPSAPGPIMGASTSAAGGTGAGSTGQVAVLEERPAPPAPGPAEGDSAPADAGTSAAGARPSVPSSNGGSASTADPGTAQRTFTACTASRGSSCDYIYIAMQGDQAAACVQLTLDSCGSYSNPGLPIDVPLSWRVASGSVGVASKVCVPGEYNADSVPVVSAKGSIAWNRDAPQPSAFVLDVTLEPSTARGGDAVGSIKIATQALSAPLQPCQE